MSEWVEWRCPQCGKVAIQRADLTPYCGESAKHKNSTSWYRMKRSPGAAVAEARRASFAERYSPARV